MEPSHSINDWLEWLGCQPIGVPTGFGTASDVRRTPLQTGSSSGTQLSALAGQIFSLNAIYTDLALIARNNMSNCVVFERLMRLALKAQSNCRATAEALAAIQNPAAVFARQANIANGPQQINIGSPSSRARKSTLEPKRTFGGAWRTVGPRRAEHDKQWQSRTGDRGNDRQGPRPVPVRHGLREMPGRVDYVFGGEQCSKPLARNYDGPNCRIKRWIFILNILDQPSV